MSFTFLDFCQYVGNFLPVIVLLKVIRKCEIQECEKTMVNGYNASVRSNYMQYGNAMPVQNVLPQQGIYPVPAQINVTHQTHNTTVKTPAAQQTIPQQQTQQPVVQQPAAPAQAAKPKKTNSLWEIIKSDTIAIITGSIVSLTAILAMALSPKPATKNIFSKMIDNIKAKWANYRVDYKARMAAKAPEHCRFTPNIIR